MAIGSTRKAEIAALVTVAAIARAAAAEQELDSTPGRIGLLNVRFWQPIRLG